MADLDVRRTRGVRWVWVVGGLLFLAVVTAAALLLYAEREDAGGPPVGGVPDSLIMDEEPGPDGPVVAAAIVPAVSEFSQTCGSGEMGRQELAPDHEHEAGCLRLLAVAINSVVQRDTVGSVVLDSALAEYRRQADRLEESNPLSAGHAVRVRDVAVSASSVMQRVQRTRLPAGAEAAERMARSREAAEQIRPDTPLQEQRRAIGAFFQAAEEALRVLVERPR